MVLKQNKKNILYLSYDGLLEPLGFSQVLKYLIQLSNRYKITIISFEKKIDLSNTKHVNKINDICLTNNIKWIHFNYDNWPKLISPIYNLLKLFFLVFYILLFKKISIIHIRSYLPGVIIPILLKVFKFNLIFDMRGLWADEKHDRLGWSKKSFKFKFFKKLETYLLLHSSKIISLTEGLKEFLVESRRIPVNKIEVIRTCADQEELFPLNEDNQDKIIIGYLGSADTAYDFKAVAEFYKGFLKFHNDSLLKILTKTNKENLLLILDKFEIPKSNFVFKHVTREELNKEINSFDATVFCLKENLSILASMPTKIGEVLSCGKPIICNEFNKDISTLITKNNVGFLYDFKNKYKKEIDLEVMSLINSKTIKANCIKLADREFNLNRGVEKYLETYRQVLN